MSIIVPAILPSSREDLIEKLRSLEGLVDEVQIDIVDGVFAAPPTWPYDSGPQELARMVSTGEMIPHAGECRIEVDLMVEHPELTMGAWIELGASRITIHAASVSHLPRLLQAFKTEYGYDKGFSSSLLAIGVVVPPGTNPEELTPFLDQIDYVQFMGIRNVGRQGEPFDAEVLMGVKRFRARHPNTPVQVDGGVSIHTAAKLLELGVSRLVIGSAIWKSSDVPKAIQEFKEITIERGIYE
jgi:ribulose-phosphate 3-epimerase